MYVMGKGLPGSSHLSSNMSVAGTDDVPPPFSLCHKEEETEWIGTAPLAYGIGILAAFEWVTATDAWGVANALMATSFALWIAGRCLKIGLADREARRAVLREIVEEARNG